MRKLLNFIFILIFLAGCSRPSGVSDGRMAFWKPLERDHDSVVMQLEDVLEHLDGDSIKRRLVAQLESISSKYPDNSQLQSRTAIWKGWMLRQTGKRKEAATALHYARLLCDSSKYPYDMERLRYEEGNVLHFPLPEQHKRDVESLSFFESIGDSVMMAATYISMGNTFKDIYDTVRCMDCFDHADRIFTNLGLNKPRTVNRVNMSLFAGPRGDTILQELRSMPDVRNTQAPYYVVLFYSYERTDSLKFLEELLQEIRGKKEYGVQQLHVQALIAIDRLSRGIDNDSMLKLADAVWSAYDSSMPDQTKEIITRMKAFALKDEGKIDSAFLIMGLSQEIHDRMITARRANEIHALDNKMQIDKMEEEYEQEKEVERTWTFVALAAILLIGMATALLFYLRWKSSRLSEAKSKLELEHDRMRLAASQLALEGKDKAMESVMSVIAEMRGNGVIKPTAADEISAKIRLTVNDKEEMETFRQMYDRLNPYFMRKLKERCPDLTEGQVKLAAYIAIGLSNRQISRLLSIDHQSVIKSRYRLRGKLKLERSDSLEDELRKYAEI